MKGCIFGGREVGGEMSQTSTLHFNIFFFSGQRTGGIRLDSSLHPNVNRLRRRDNGRATLTLLQEGNRGLKKFILGRFSGQGTLKTTEITFSDLARPGQDVEKQIDKNSLQEEVLFSFRC